MSMQPVNYDSIREFLKIRDELKNVGGGLEKVLDSSGVVDVELVIGSEVVYDKRFIGLCTDPKFPKFDGKYFRVLREQSKLLCKVYDSKNIIDEFLKKAKKYGCVVEHG